LADRLTPEQRSANMARIRSKDTFPELRVRKAAHGLGYRYRLHRKDLPGKPDLVFPRLSSLIFVHGCFWHRHEGCPDCSQPKSRKEYWTPKFEATIVRDARAVALLQATGWKVLIIWDCETTKPAELNAKLTAFLGPPFFA
jgi:DNA mismatch endonuclease, patch repair protein